MSVLPIVSKIFERIMQKQIFDYIRAGEMDFTVEGPWNTEKNCGPPVGRQEDFLNSRRSRMSKTVTF